MGDVINLRRARKARNRREKQARATENRTTYGTPKALKTHLLAEHEREDRVLDGHRRPDDGSGDGNTQ